MFYLPRLKSHLVALTVLGMIVLTTTLALPHFYAGHARTAGATASSKLPGGPHAPLIQPTGFVKTANSESARAASETYGNLPLQFEANAGQTDGSVKFLSRGGSYTLFLTATEAVLVLAPKVPRKRRAPEVTGNRPLEDALSADGRFEPAENISQGPERGNPEGSNEDIINSTVVHMKLEGANPAPQIAGADPLPGHVNYIVGSNPANWHADISTYAQVQYRDVYPGVDLVYYGNQRQLEYDFVVAPGANVNAIRLAYEGAESVCIEANGDLTLETANGAIRQHRPVIYQTVDGVRREVGGKYVYRSDGRIGFEVPSYDQSRPLIIDPVLSYSTLLGGANDYGYAIAVDASGSAYVTGYTYSATFPTTAGSYQTTLRGYVDAFVAKLNSTGTALVYSTFLGGNDYDYGYAIAVNSSGNAYVAGYTNSADFPTTPGVVRNSIAASDTFVTELNPAGNGLVYSTFLGGSDYDYASAIALDTSGNAYIAGYTYSSDFSTTVGAFRSSLSGSVDSFVTKLNVGGTSLLYSTYLGGSGFDYSSSIAVDSSGNAYVAGYTDSLTFPTANPLQTAHDRGIYRSSTAGSTWNLSSTGLGSPTVRFLVVHPTTPTTIYAGTASGVYKSTNGGSSWSTTNLT
jgi:hypothetical protein